MINFISSDTFFIVLLILSVLFPLIACTSILIEKNGNRKLQWLMFSIFLGISLYYLRHLLALTGLITDFPFLLRGFVPIYYLIQPSIYFYVLINLDENYTFSKKDLLHLIPAVYSIVDNYTFYAGGPQYWQHWSNLIVSDYGNIANYPGFLMKAKFNFLLRVLLYISYVMFAWRIYIKNIQLNKEIKNQFVLKWLKLFLIIISIYVFTNTLASVFNFNFIILKNSPSNYIFDLTLYINVLTIIVLASYILFNPILLYGLPKINFNTISDNDKSLSNFKSMQIYDNKTDLNEHNLAVTLIDEIKEKQLYTDVAFSLALASQYFSIPSHHISFIINKYIKKSVPDVICEMRIEHAIHLLKDNYNKKYTMEALGNLSGFKSRSTFYSSFKKITGITPNEYYQNLKKS